MRLTKFLVLAELDSLNRLYPHMSEHKGLVFKELSHLLATLTVVHIMRYAQTFCDFDGLISR